ncbi:hypothetical protein [Corynebacterium sp.]|uniref:hypothetical protein n=1 Tax=Corynebacterium sp. TaxID=1720 RepID=UPI0026DF990B|nr:hypothetical protein [Corynebacterium sp.]MDO5513449.1 hypothetical protein [Corynebacterium sp.]
MIVDSDVKNGPAEKHWAAAYVGLVVGLALVALVYSTSGMWPESERTGTVLLLVVPVALPLLALTVLRGWYRLAVLGLALAPVVAVVSFFAVIVGGAIAA